MSKPEIDPCQAQLEAQCRGLVRKLEGEFDVEEFSREDYVAEYGGDVLAMCDGDFLEIVKQDFVRSDWLDIEYRVGSDRKYRSVELCAAWGGPCIWVDTGTGGTNCGVVQGRWGSNSIDIPFTDRVGLDEYFEELWETT